MELIAWDPRSEKLLHRMSVRLEQNPPPWLPAAVRTTTTFGMKFLMIAMRDIRAFARRIAEEFKPRKIILFGSYAYGTPTEDSDVDVMVVMPCKGHPVDAALDIRQRFHPGFPLDLLVYAPAELRRRLKMNDFFLREIVRKGKVQYETRRQRVGRQSRG